MKKTTKLILIIAIVLLAVSVVCGVVLGVLQKGSGDEKTVSTLGYGEVASPDGLTNAEKIAGYASVLDYGAKPDDNSDDTDAFEAAIKKNIAVYVPAGKYFITRPLPFNDQNFFGDGENASVIVGNISDVKKPIIYLGGSSTVYDISLEYSAELISGEEKKGERVAVMCGAAVGFGPGGGIRDVAFRNVGTAVYSDSSDEFGSMNCSFDRITLENFTWCGFDFNCAAGFGNCFSQITAKSSKGEGLFTFTGSGGSDILENIALEGCELRYALGYTELSGVVFETFTSNECSFTDGEQLLIKEE